MDKKKCKSCEAMIPKAAKVCSYCRKTQGWTWPAKIALIFIGLVILVPAIGHKDAPSPPSPTVEAAFKKMKAADLAEVLYQTNTPAPSKSADETPDPAETITASAE